MLHWKNSILPPSATLTDVMANLNETGARIVNIADDNGQLLGIITDGDLLRALLKGCEQTMAPDIYLAAYFASIAAIYRKGGRAE